MKLRLFFSFTLPVILITVAISHSAFGEGWEGAQQIDVDPSVPMLDIPQQDPRNPTVAINAAGDAIAIFRTYIPIFGIHTSVNVRHYEVCSGWATLRGLDGSSDNIFPPQVAIDENGRGIAIFDLTSALGFRDIFVRHYYPEYGWAGGTTPMAINDASLGSVQQPQLAIDRDGNAIAVYAQQAENGRFHIFANRYDRELDDDTSDFNNWWDEDPVRVDNLTGERAQYPDIAFDGDGNAIVVFSHRYRAGDERIYANRFNRESGEWDAAPTRIDAEIGLLPFPAQPQIAVNDAGHAIAFWRQRDDRGSAKLYARLYRAEPLDGDRGWDVTEPPVEIASVPDNANFNYQVALDPAGNAIVVYQGSVSIYARRYIAGSPEWSDGVWTDRVELSTTMNAMHPQVAIDTDGNAVVVFEQPDSEDRGITRIFACRFDATSGEWSDPQPIDAGIGHNASLPRISLDGVGNAIVVFDQEEFDPETDLTVHYVYANRYTVSATYYVDEEDGDDETGDGSSEDPFKTIQHPLNLPLRCGTRIVVRRGDYHENINFNGKAVTVESEDPEDPAVVADTIINGDINGDGRGDGTVVTFNSGEDSSSVLSGFTIKGGRADNGSGINCSSDSSPTIINNVIIRNSADSFGGGIYLSDGSEPILTGNTITRNTADNGGGIYCESSPTLINLTISRNLAFRDGGGICFDGASPRVERCAITLNTAVRRGGGINCRDSSPQIRHTTITNNLAVNGGGIHGLGSDEAGPISRPEFYNCLITGNLANRGAGIRCSTRFSPLVAFNTIADNRASISGGGIHCYSRSHPRIEYSIVWGNNALVSGPQIYKDFNSLPRVYDSDIEGGWDFNPFESLDWPFDEPNNIGKDPLFVSSYFGDYCLSQKAAGQAIDSPCVDFGDDYLTYAPSGTARTDRFSDSRYSDLGYHYPLSALRGMLAKLDKSAYTMSLTEVVGNLGDLISEAEFKSSQDEKKDLSGLKKILKSIQGKRPKKVEKKLSRKKNSHKKRSSKSNSSAKKRSKSSKKTKAKNK